MSNNYFRILAVLLLAMIPALNSAAQATATVYIDAPNRAYLYLYDSSTRDYTPVELANTGDTPNIVTFNPATQSTWNVEGSLWQIIRNGQVIAQDVQATADGYDIPGMANGDVLRLVTINPNAGCTVTMDWGRYGRQAISEIKANDKAVDASSGSFAVAPNTLVLLYPNKGYKILSLTLNGAEVGYIPASGCYACNIERSSTIAIDAEPESDTTISLDVNEAAAVAVYISDNPFALGQPIEGIKDGKQDITMPAGMPYLQVKAAEGYVVDKAECLDKDGYTVNMQNESYAGYRYINVVDYDVVAVTIVANKQDANMLSAMVYCDDVSALKSYFVRTSDRKFPIDSDAAATSLHNGYQPLSIRASQNPVRLNLDFRTAVSNNVYLNGEQVTSLRVDGKSLWGDFSIPDNSVLKIFTTGAPTACTATFVADGLSAGEYTVKADMISTVDTSVPYACFAGTLLQIEGEKISSVDVDGVAVEAAEGVYALTVSTDCTITIKASTGIEALAADQAPARVFNMQGMEVTGRNLPAGIYIVNGKKQYIRK